MITIALADATLSTSTPATDYDFGISYPPISTLVFFDNVNTGDVDAIVYIPHGDEIPYSRFHELASDKPTLKAYKKRLKKNFRAE